MNNSLQKYTAHVAFVVDTQPRRSILMTKRLGKEGYSLPHSEIEDGDGHSGVIAAARMLAEKFQGIDPRELTTYDDSHSSVVDWEAFEKAKELWEQDPPVDQSYGLMRNPIHILWQKIFTKTPIWNSDDQTQIVYFIEIGQKDVELFQSRLPQISFEICQEKPLQASQGLEKLIDKIEIFEIVNSRSYLEVESTFLFFGFKGPSFDKWIPPRAFLHTYAIFDGLYRRRKEEWIQVNVSENKFPTPEQLKQAKAIIMPGSSFSSYEQIQWIRDLEEFIRTSYQEYPHLRYLCICFGLQVVSQAFGGKVEPFPQRKENKMFYLTGNETLIMNVEALKEVPQFKDMDIQKEHLINKAHGDEVTVVPEFFLNVGTSASCKNEVLISNDYRIFGYQAHPEYSNKQQQVFVVNIRSFFQKLKQKDIYQNENFLKPWRLGCNDKIHRDLCMAFLKN